MSEGLSINRLAELLEADRRTVRNWSRRARLEPVCQGPHGPLFSLPRVAAVLADADRLADATADRQDSWRWIQGQHAGAHETVSRLLDALAKTLPKPALRHVRESAAELLRIYAGEMEALTTHPSSPSAGPEWSKMTDCELGALEALVDDVETHDAGGEDKRKHPNGASR